MMMSDEGEEGGSAPANMTVRPEAMSLYRVRRTILKMLRKRHYNIDQDQFDMDIHDFMHRYGEKPVRKDMTIIAEHETDADDTIVIFFAEDEKVGVKPIKNYSDFMVETKVSHGILIVKQGLTPFAKTALQEMSANFHIEHFREAELLVDITEHKLVPTHQPLSSDDKAHLLERYKLKETQLPRIQRSDPVARYFGLKTGDVVKITRPSETAGKYITYRICI